MGKIPNLRLENFSVRGPDGKRDNLLRLFMVISDLLPSGVVMNLNVEHDKNCPCIEGRGMPFCTCDLVDVTLSASND